MSGTEIRTGIIQNNECYEDQYRCLLSESVPGRIKDLLSKEVCVIQGKKQGLDWCAYCPRKNVSEKEGHRHG